MKNPARGPSDGSKNLPKHIGQTIWEQPGEFAKSAGKPFAPPPEKAGQADSRSPQETDPTSPSGFRGARPQQQKKPEPSPEEKRKHSMLQAFQRELEEINELQKKRREEMRQRWYDQEELKKQREEEAKKAKQPLFEPVTKVKRGILGGAQRMFGLGKKQRQVEIAKTPTN